jgi:hypothetical protein
MLAALTDYTFAALFVALRFAAFAFLAFFGHVPHLPSELAESEKLAFQDQACIDLHPLFRIAGG